MKYDDYIITKLKRGANTFAKCSGDYVVQYFDHWIENNEYLYIQMELCSDNLKNIIQQKKKFFKKEKSVPFEAIEYFISCQIYQDIIECVKYLHEDKMIHRDLKPENILVLKHPSNHKFIKLGDFDTLKYVEYNKNSHTTNQGTSTYMAPEVSTGKYDHKCDIYSLGKVAIDLFEFKALE